MNTRLTKEKALFLLGVLLLAWVALGIGLLASRRAPAAGSPALGAYACQQGDPRIADSLATPPLSRCLGPGDPFRLAERTPRIPPPPPRLKPVPDLAALRAEVERQLAALRDAGKGRLTKTAVAATGGESLWAKKPKVADGSRTADRGRTVRPRSFDLAGTLRVETPGAPGWALLRDRASHALLSGTVGDLLPGTLRVHAIRDDGATLVTAQGTQVILPGRFGDGSQP